MLNQNSCNAEELRVPLGPPACEVTVRVTFPWKEFRLRKFSMIVELEPGWMLTAFGVKVMLKSVATTVRVT